ncbi:CheR family methyltransferase [Paucidesulfovibrio longus]|uniref:CheR family methyltransferase n=1 Tax=Paucidesulfovibrio longus TaxID=889 RepID=UPI0003B4BCD0|nr:protein-glutamate O-methyltransferase CheR [Paucidesulfovibrio longus]
MYQLTEKEFKDLRDFIYEYAGINLTDQKRALVVGRLQKVLSREGFSSFAEYYNYVRADKSGKAVEELINRISTNHTFFFREKAHFDYLHSTVLPEITERIARSGKKDLRLWCAAAATGEEPYTLAMVLREFFGSQYPQWQAGMLATDISTQALATAQRALYPDERMTHTPPGLRNKYFQRLGPDQWAVREELKRDVIYRRFNLMSTRWPFKGKFHIVFCRNVMIYFDQVTRSRLAKMFHEFMQPGGYFFIGHSETLGRDDCPFEYVMPAVYRKVV